MGSPTGFTPTPLKRPLPPGYTLEGEAGMDGDVLYHWMTQADPDDSSTWRFGPGEETRFRAWQLAWRDYRSGGTDPEAVDGPVN